MHSQRRSGSRCWSPVLQPRTSDSSEARSHGPWRTGAAGKTAACRSVDHIVRQYCGSQETGGREHTSHRMGANRTLPHFGLAHRGVEDDFCLPVSTGQSVSKCFSMRMLGSSPAGMAMGILQKGPIGHMCSLSRSLILDIGITYNLERLCYVRALHTCHTGGSVARSGRHRMLWYSASICKAESRPACRGAPNIAVRYPRVEYLVPKGWG